MRIPLSLGKALPGPLRTIGVQVLCNTFAQVFDVKAPNVASLPPSSALWAFREFSAACMEEALASPEYAAGKRADLEVAARELGAKLRMALKPTDEELPLLVHALYAAIEIEVSAQVPGEFTFHRCFFAGRYSPELCAFMSAFDSGFVAGLCDGSGLVFLTRITEGAPCCRARFVQVEGSSV